MQTSEEQPLLGRNIGVEEFEDSKQNGVILDFEIGDLENPREWPKTFKWAIVLLLACMAFAVSVDLLLIKANRMERLMKCRTFTCIGIVPLASSIVRDLDHSHTPDSSASALLVTIWELGEAAGPLLIAPLSEVFGRYPVMNGCNILFITATILAALSQSTQSLIALRALTGLAVASNVLNPAILGDIFESDERGSPMSLIMLAPLIGGAIGPAISGAIAETLGWREVLFIAAGLAFACEILFLTCFRETYKVAILRNRVASQAREAGGHPSGLASDHKSFGKLWESITRPAQVLCGSSVLLALSVFGSITFSYFYVMSITLADILRDRYGFSPALTGLSFMSFSK
jgi:MFS family permease